MTVFAEILYRFSYALETDDFPAKAPPDNLDYFNIYLLHDIVKEIMDRKFPVRPTLRKFLISSNAE